MTEVYLALGANIGDPASNIEQAVQLLGDGLQNVKQAPLYRSKAVGHTDQPDFINTAVSASTDMPPERLFQFIKEIERQTGRQKRFRWGPREIDIDIIFYGDQTLETPELTIPHPRFSERDFVLRPLADLNPALTDPLTKKTVSELLGKVSNRSLI